MYSFLVCACLTMFAYVHECFMPCILVFASVFVFVKCHCIFVYACGFDIKKSKNTALALSGSFYASSHCDEGLL